MRLRTDVGYVDGAGRFTQAGVQAVERLLKDTLSAYLTTADFATYQRVTPLASQTAATSASLSFTQFDATKYRLYVFDLENVAPVTDNADLWGRVSTNGGTSYDSGASDYKWALSGMGGASFGVSSAAASAMRISPGQGNAAGERGVSGRLVLHHAGTSAYARADFIGSGFDNASNVQTFESSGVRVADQVTNAFRFRFSTGDIASGTIRMFGVT